MKKIGFIITYEKGATLNRILSMINVFKGYEIHLIGPINNINNYSDYITNKKIIFHKINLLPKKSNFFLRYIYELIYSMKCSREMKKIKCDLEIISIPFISLIISSFFFKSRSMRILDIRDLVWEYYDKTSNIQKLIFFLLKKIHLLFFYNFKFVLFTNKYEFEILKKDFPDLKKNIISNGISKIKFDLIQNSIKKKILIDKKKTIIYVGNIGFAQNLLDFIDTIRFHKKLEFILVGSGNDLNRLINYVQENKIKNVKFIGNVPENKTIKYYYKANYLYAKLDKKFFSAIPSKLYEYLSTGKKIIYSGNGAAVELLKNFENIYLVNDTKEDLKKLFNKIENEYEYELSTKNVDLIKKKFIREKISLKLLNILNEK